MDEGNQVFPQSDSAALLVIEFPSFRDFIDAYSPIISEAGIFIRNADVSESNAFSVGDRVDFEVRLKDDFRLIQGSGDVVWLGPSEAAEGAAGTAIRFHDVDEPSQRLISRLVGNYVRDGGKLFEIGGPTVAQGEAEPDFVHEHEQRQPSEGLMEFEESGGEAELTAENLEAGEADELFADDDDEPAARLEIESVSLEEVEGNGLGAESPSLDPDGPVGLDTIAIPSDLLASLASEGKAEALKAATDFESGPEEPAVELADEPIAAAVEDSLEPEELPFDPAEAMPPDEFPSAEVHSVDDQSSLVAEAETFGGDEPLLGEDADQGSLEAAAVSVDGQLGGGGGIPDDIAQVAEELSGVHRFELPEPDEISGVDYAGSASVGTERNTGGRIAALSVVFVLLGAGAFYFGDTILETLGWGSDESAPAEPVVRSGEAQPPSAPPVDNETVDLDASTRLETEAGGEVAETEPPSGTPSSESVQAQVGRDSAEPVAGATAPDPSTGDVSGSLAATAPSAGPVVDPARVPAASATSRRVERIAWREEGGETIVTIRLDAPISEALVDVVRVRDGAPREVIKIQGVEVPYSPRDVAVGSRHVVRLRTGLHRSQSGSALHVVADLTGAGVTVLSVESTGRDVLITFS